MRAVVFGYHNVGDRCLRVLHARGVEVALVITHRDRPDENIWFRRVADTAAELGLPFVYGEDPADPRPSAADLADELEALDLDAALDDDVVVVEWGAGFVDALVEAPLLVQLRRAEDSDVRSAAWRRDGPPRGPAVR